MSLLDRLKGRLVVEDDAVYGTADFDEGFPDGIRARIFWFLKKPSLYGTIAGVFMLSFGWSVWQYGFVPRTVPAVVAIKDAPAGATLTTAFREAMKRQRVHGWLNNDCCAPTVFLLPYQNFEAGNVDVWRRLAQELRDNLSRVRGTDAMDPRIDQMSAALNNDIDKFWFPSFESKLDEAIARLDAYIENLPSRRNFSARADNLSSLMGNLASMMGATLNAIAQATPYSSEADGAVVSKSTELGTADAYRLFYRAKGQAYATLWLLEAVRIEFGTGSDSVLAQKNATDLVDHAIFWLKKAVRLSPLIVYNGDPDSDFFPNHLNNFGVRFGQARDKIDSLADLLRKG